jgi:DNA topoisomerase IB
VALLSTCFLRPGSEIYAHENGSFGLTTLRKRHVTVQGDSIRFDYRGKHGRRQRHEVRSRRLAFILRAMRSHSGIGAFKYVDGRGAVRDLSRAHINAYIKRAMGARFSARDFRTWAGTLLCAGALSRAAGAGHGHGNSAAAGERVIGSSPSARSHDAAGAHANGHAATPSGTGPGRAHTNGAGLLPRHDTVRRPANRTSAPARSHDPWRNPGSVKRAVAGAVRETSNWLGNTPAMSRRSYIHPAVLQAFERGEVVQHALHRPEVLIASGSTGLDPSEWELLLLLRRDRPARGTRPASGRGAKDTRGTSTPVQDPARPAAIALPARRSA